MRYRAFADTARLLRVAVPEGARVTFWIEMPKYWPEARKAKQDGQPHRQKPDLDNCVKALLDAMHSDDSHVAELHAVKRWSRRAGIEVEAT
jgi:Holliday junction resolvase RusA-like endonuclease